MRERVSRFSPLYCAYNGFALGAFLAGAQLSIAAPRYRAMRQRTHEFLAEIGLEVRWPARHADYVTAFPALFEPLLRAVRAQSQALGECAGIGAKAVLYAASYPRVSPVQRRAIRANWVPALARHGVPAEVADGFVRGLAKASASGDAAALLSQAFNLVPHLLQPLPAEPDTCFVAMPFRPPYAGYFRSYYQPALSRAGFRAIRAWGGLSEEEYYPFIAPLMIRCASVLAELSTLNLNVVNEIGLAHGANRPVFLVMGLHERRPPPSNLGDLVTLRYDHHDPGWPAQDVPRLARYIRWIWRAYSESMTQERVIEDNAQQLVLYLRAAGRAVPYELWRLAYGTNDAGADDAMR